MKSYLGTARTVGVSDCCAPESGGLYAATGTPGVQVRFGRRFGYLVSRESDNLPKGGSQGGHPQRAFLAIGVSSVVTQPTL